LETRRPQQTESTRHFGKPWRSFQERAAFLNLCLFYHHGCVGKRHLTAGLADARFQKDSTKEFTQMFAHSTETWIATEGGKALTSWCVLADRANKGTNGFIYQPSFERHFQPEEGS